MTLPPPGQVDSALLARARVALAGGPLDAVRLIEAVCALPGAPVRVAERLAEALFARQPGFRRDAEGRWWLGAAAAGDAPGAMPSAAETALARARDGWTPLAVRRSGAASAAGDVSLEHVPFAVVDVETTGHSPLQLDRVTEIAIVHVQGGRVEGRYETLVNPERGIPPAIVALTGIAPHMVAAAPRFPEVADEVVARLRGRVFVAHNAAFDWRFVRHEVERAGGMALEGDPLCTVRLARRLLPALPRRSLDVVAGHLGISIEARHRAAGDAVATAEVLVRLLAVARGRGAETWGGLMELLGGGARSRSRAPAPVTPRQEP